MVVGVAAIVFLVVITVTLGGWWVWESSERLRRRLGRAGDRMGAYVWDDYVLIAARSVGRPSCS